MATCSWSTADGWRANRGHCGHIFLTRNAPARCPPTSFASSFWCRALFKPGEITLRHIDLDRVVLGGAVPTGAPLALEAPASLAAEYFAERRELGILNIGASGAITVDGTALRDEQARRRCTSDAEARASCSRATTRRGRRGSIIVSYPAHASHPTTHIDGGVRNRDGARDCRARELPAALQVHPSAAACKARSS